MNLNKLFHNLALKCIRYLTLISFYFLCSQPSFATKSDTSPKIHDGDNHKPQSTQDLIYTESAIFGILDKHLGAVQDVTITNAAPYNIDQNISLSLMSCFKSAHKHLIGKDMAFLTINNQNNKTTIYNGWALQENYLAPLIEHTRYDIIFQGCIAPNKPLSKK